MKAEEIDQLVRLAKFDRTFRGERGDMLHFISLAVQCMERYNENRDEGNLTILCKTLFGLANKYNMRVNRLEVREDTDNKTLSDTVYSMAKICMTHYSIQKKIIILIGMFCNLCYRMEWDVIELFCRKVC